MATKHFISSGTDPVAVIAGTLRNNLGTWELLNDSGHKPVFIESVITHPTHIEVIHSNIGTSKVGSLIAAPDETLAQAGIFCGSSVQIGKSIIKLGQSSPVYNDYVHFDGSNWISLNGVFTVTFDSGVLTVTHPELPTDESALNITLTPRYGPSASFRPVISSAVGAVTKSSVSLYFRTGTDAIQAVATTDMRVYISHGGGNINLDPRTLTQEKYPNSNIWVYGAMVTA